MNFVGEKKAKNHFVITSSCTFFSYNLKKKIEKENFTVINQITLELHLSLALGFLMGSALLKIMGV